VRTARVDARLRGDFTGAAYARAVALIDRIAAELGAWSIVTETDRVEAAALEFAGADLERLDEAVRLALYDWRDLLVAAGDA
jgi:hypothetical protein